MNRRRAQKEDTRGQILEAARALLAKDGFEAMNTRAVAQRAGVAAGTVFLHFPDKVALVEALLHDHIEAALEDALRALPRGDLVAQLTHVAAGLYAAYDANPALSRVYLRETLFAPGSGTRPLAKQLRRFEAWAASRCEEAAARGEIEPMAPQLAFTAFFSFYFAALVAGLRGDLGADARISMLEALLRRHFQSEAQI